jgi:hypothetical protein
LPIQFEGNKKCFGFHAAVLEGATKRVKASGVQYFVSAQTKGHVLEKFLERKTETGCLNYGKIES